MQDLGNKIRNVRNRRVVWDRECWVWNVSIGLGILDMALGNIRTERWNKDYTIK